MTIRYTTNSVIFHFIHIMRFKADIQKLWEYHMVLERVSYT